MTNHDLELYVFMDCPYCIKVMNYMEDAGIEIPLKESRTDQENRRKLLEVGGKIQVPCLFVDGEPMYESDDIIAWFKESVA